MARPAARKVAVRPAIRPLMPVRKVRLVPLLLLLLRRRVVHGRGIRALDAVHLVLLGPLAVAVALDDVDAAVRVDASKGEADAALDLVRRRVLLRAAEHRPLLLLLQMVRRADGAVELRRVGGEVPRERLLAARRHGRVVPRIPQRPLA